MKDQAVHSGTVPTMESSVCCCAGSHMLQAMGLGGMRSGGIDPSAMLKASGYEYIPGLELCTGARNVCSMPNLIDLSGVLEGCRPLATRTCTWRLRHRANGKPAPEARSPLMRRARGRIRERSVLQPVPTVAGPEEASPLWRNTCPITSANFPAQRPGPPRPPISRLVICIPNSMTNSTGPRHVEARMNMRSTGNLWCLGGQEKQNESRALRQRH
jgi:hypothetical protein